MARKTDKCYFVEESAYMIKYASSFFVKYLRSQIEIYTMWKWQILRIGFLVELFYEQIFSKKYLKSQTKIYQLMKASTSLSRHEKIKSF